VRRDIQRSQAVVKSVTLGQKAVEEASVTRVSWTRPRRHALWRPARALGQIRLFNPAMPNWCDRGTIPTVDARLDALCLTSAHHTVALRAF